MAKKVATQAVVEELDQAEISVLDFPYCVQKRRGMYLPSKDHTISEIVDNSIDEGAAGYATVIIVEIDKDQVVTVRDNGRGIPVKMHSDPRYKGLTQAEVAYTVLHAGGKFGNEKGYKTVTGGLNGVGASAVNALSEWLELEVYCGQTINKCRFEKGIIVDNMKQIGTYEDKSISGTSVSFKLADCFWDGEDFNIKHINSRIRQLSYLNPNLTFVVNIDTTVAGIDYKIEETYHHPEGLKNYIERLTKARTCISSIISNRETRENIDIEFAFCYTDSYSEDTKSFVNNINTDDGGDHLIGLRHGIHAALSKYILEKKLNHKIEISDVTEGVCGIISIKLKDPHFDGQGKSKIKMPWVKTEVKDAVGNMFYKILDSDPETAKTIIDKALLAQKAKIMAQKARESIRKAKTLVEGKPEKFADCQSKDPAECEIWIAEGDSAGGSLKEARDRKTQAILPIFGKVLNVLKANLSQVLGNPKLLDMIKALKCSIAEEFDITKLRYHKIILASDADVDGAHIALLFMVFYYIYLPEIIENGYLYIPCPPLYKIEKGKVIRYAYSDKERDTLIQEIGNSAKISRYKGLGEMDSDQLWDSTMDPETRTLIQVTVADAEAALEMLTICMGEIVEPRREFIMEHAAEAEYDF